MIKLVEDENGIYMILEDQEAVENLLDKSESHQLSEIMDASGFIGNDWHLPESIGLTEAPAIAYGLRADESYEEVYYFPHYHTHSFVKVLLESGKVYFNLLI